MIDTCGFKVALVASAWALSDRACSPRLASSGRILIACAVSSRASASFIPANSPRFRTACAAMSSQLRSAGNWLISSSGA